MASNPTSSAALAVSGARDLIAASNTFKNHTHAIHGTGTANAANHIYYNDVVNPAGTIADLRPFVVLTLAAHNFESLVQCSVPSLVLNGGVLVAFFDNPRATDNNDAYIEYLNWCYGTLDEMSGQFGNDTNYPFTSIEPAVNPERTNALKRKSDGDDYFYSAVIFNHERKS